MLLGGVSAAVLAACSSSGDSAPVTNFGGSPDVAARLGVRFPDGFRAPSVAVVGSGAQRFPFVVIAEDGFPMTTSAPESIDIELMRDGSTLETFTVPRRGAGQFTPYYPLVFTPEEVGSYVARTDFSDLDVEFRVEERATVPLLQIGDKLPAFETPTFANSAGVDPVCTRTEPCPFHEISLAEAVSNGRPTVLLIATPEFCQTDVCGPSVEFLIEAGARRDDLNVIHAEVFADPRNNTGGQIPELAPLLTELELAFEPSLFVADATGTIVDARHFAIDRQEFEEAFAAV